MIEEKENLKKYGFEYDSICLVYAPLGIQISRLLERDDRGYDNSKKIIDAQMDIEIKKGFADYIIDNSKDLEHLQVNVGGYLDWIEKEYEKLL